MFLSVPGQLKLVYSFAIIIIILIVELLKSSKYFVRCTNLLYSSKFLKKFKPLESITQINLLLLSFEIRLEVQKHVSVDMPWFKNQH